MAISFDGFETDSGANATYWRITHINVDYTAPVLDINNIPVGSDVKGVIEVKLHGYISKPARDNGKSPILLKNININSTDIDINAISRSDLYTAIMSLPEWENSTEI